MLKQQYRPTFDSLSLNLDQIFLLTAKGRVNGIKNGSQRIFQSKNLFFVFILLFKGRKPLLPYSERFHGPICLWPVRRINTTE